MIHTGDCIEVMRGMEADSVDAVVTDPPYGIAFMGKQWDGPASFVERKAGGATFDQVGGNHHPTSQADVARTRLSEGRKFEAWCQQWGTEALRVTRPGGYLLAFGGTRTHHRLVCGLEDAGWIIRDELTWVYASGFPKGKANLKPAHEPIVLARKPGPLRPLGIDAARIPSESDTARKPSMVGDTSAPFGKGFEMGGNGSDLGRWPSNLLLSDPALFDEPNPAIIGSGATSDGQHAQQKLSVTDSSTFGGVTRPGDEYGYGDTGGYSRFFRIPERTTDDDRGMAGQSRGVEEAGTPDGRAVPDGGGFSDGRVDYPRAFLIPKAARHDREPAVLPDEHERSKRFSTHPTVKPTDLMRHLIRLVTPPGGTVLDCFAGSGSTLIAAELEGFPWIGIEQDASYVAIAEARLNGTQRGLGLDVGAPTKAPPKTHPDLSKHQPAHGHSGPASWFVPHTAEEPVA